MQLERSELEHNEHGKSEHYDCVVLDLDGTLVHSAKRNKTGTAQRISFPDMHGDPTELWVHKRPGFDFFLQSCFKSTTVGVWSRGQPGYVDAVVGLFPQKPAFVYNWCHCDRARGKIFKRLNNIPHSGRTVMVEDEVESLELCDRIATIIIPEWDPKAADDKELYQLSARLFGEAKIDSQPM